MSSHRPWETPPPPRITSRMVPTSSPPPAPPPPPAVLAGIPPPPISHGYRPPPQQLSTLPPLRNNGHKRQRTASSSGSGSLDLSPAPHIPTPSTGTTYQVPSEGSYNHGRRFAYPTASSLSGLVAQIYNVVQDLSGHLDPNPGHLPKPPPPSKLSLPDYPTLDDIGTCLEAVYTTLHSRVETLSRSPLLSTGPQKKAALVAAESAAVDSLAHETLKKDASQLSAALSRSQKRAETLEKKMVAFENESEQNALERDRLVSNIEILEETVAELRKERDQVTKELTVSGGQWSRIIGNAAQMERGLWEEVKKRQGAEKADLELEGVESKCAQCAGNLNKLVDANRALKRRVEALEGAIERVRGGGKEMGMLVQRLGLLNGQLEGELGGVMAGAAASNCGSDGCREVNYG